MDSIATVLGSIGYVFPSFGDDCSAMSRGHDNIQVLIEELAWPTVDHRHIWIALHANLAMLSAQDRWLDQVYIYVEEVWAKFDLIYKQNFVAILLTLANGSLGDTGTIWLIDKALEIREIDGLYYFYIAEYKSSLPLNVKTNMAYAISRILLKEIDVRPTIIENIKAIKDELLGCGDSIIAKELDRS